MSRELRFEVPLPPYELSPNAPGRGNWRKYQDAANGYRDAVRLYALQAMNTSRWQAPARVRVSIVFETAGRGRKDGYYRPADCANAVSAFKAGYDGLVRAGLFADDNWKVMELGTTQIRPDLGPGVLVVVEAID